MEESSERPVRLGEYKIPVYPWTGLIDISMVDDDMTIVSISQEDRAAKYQQMVKEMNQESLRWLEIRDFFSSDRENLIGTREFLVEPIRRERSFMILPPRYSSNLVFDLLEEDLLIGGVSERPRLPPIREAARTRDLPSRVSRRSLHVSPPSYLRHRFLPQSRKSSSAGRQR